MVYMAGNNKGGKNVTVILKIHGKQDTIHYTTVSIILKEKTSRGEMEQQETLCFVKCLVESGAWVEMEFLVLMGESVEVCYHHQQAALYPHDPYSGNIDPYPTYQSPSLMVDLSRVLKLHYVERQTQKRSG